MLTVITKNKQTKKIFLGSHMKATETSMKGTTYDDETGMCRNDVNTKLVCTNMKHEYIVYDALLGLMCQKSVWFQLQ